LTRCFGNEVFNGFKGFLEAIFQFFIIGHSRTIFVISVYVVYSNIGNR
jgi:hypothetical protein